MRAVFRVLLTCRACAQYVRTEVRGRVCSLHADHVHVDAEDKMIVAWNSAHYDPEMEVIAVRSEH